MKTIGILGTGHMGKALARQFAQHLGQTILWGSREPEQAKALIGESGLTHVRAVGYEEAVQQADLIIPALPAAAQQEWAIANRTLLKGKTVVDISNPFNADFSGFTTAWGESSAERLQDLLPESTVIGAFKNTFFAVAEEPVFEGGVSDVLVTGDDDEAVRGFIASLAPLPFRFLHAGKLANTRTIERWTLLELELAVRYGTYPYISTRVFGLPEGAQAR